MSSQIVPIASLEPKAPCWLWHDYLLRGGINLIVGAKGVGKTSLVCWLAARASMGGEGFGGRPLRAFIDSQEDDPEVVLRPRIEAAGADLALIETRRPGQPPWTFPRDLEPLIGYLERSERRGRPVDVIVLDSLAAYIPRFTQAELAGEALERLTLVCQRFACALVFIHHFNKYGRSVDAAIGGAGAVTRVARTVFIFGEAGKPGPAPEPTATRRARPAARARGGADPRLPETERRRQAASAQVPLDGRLDPGRRKRPPAPTPRRDRMQRGGGLREAASATGRRLGDGDRDGDRLAPRLPGGRPPANPADGRRRETRRDQPPHDRARPREAEVPGDSPGPAQRTAGRRRLRRPQR
jgi:hypothetical protein